MFSTISPDAQAILRSVGIFAGTPDDALEWIAGALEPVVFPAGATIFAKGDPGDCLYIICEGRLRAHDGALKLSELGPGDVFGEMAALDPDVRSASVTALSDTQLLRLDQQPLAELLDRQPAVARHIIAVLCRRLRARVREHSDDWAYMQEFEQIIVAAQAVEAGVYSSSTLDQVARRSDALGQLGRVFQHMVRQVDTREQRLQAQVQELRIEIDRARQGRQVAEITETDYFRQLQHAAAALRAELAE